MDPATAARAAPPGSRPADAAPTTDAACSDARAESTSPAPRAATPRRSGSQPRPTACSPSGSRRAFVGRFVLAYLHRPRYCLYAQVVVRHFRPLVPVEPGGIADWLLEPWGCVAVGDDIEPVAVAPVLGDAAFVGREQDRAARRAESLHLDESQLAGGEVEARDV